MLRSTCSLLLGLSALAFTGCSGNFNGSSSPLSATPTELHGSIMGGRQAIQGARIYLMGIGTSGYGEPSVSLMNNVPNSTFADTTTVPGKTLYYVKSGSAASGGAFTITGDYTCPAGTYVYLLALGGSPDAGVNTNEGIGLMAGLGFCPSAPVPPYYQTGSLPSYINMNEATTVAMAYALAGFATDALDMSSSGTVLAQNSRVGTGFANLPNLVAVATGLIQTKAFFNTASSVPSTLLATLSNILAACVNSTTISSDSCNTLFGAATNASGARPTDTASAAINIAHSPGGSKVATLFALQSSSSPYQPALSSAPQDFSVGIQYSAAVSGPVGVAIGPSFVYYTNGSSSNGIHPNSVGQYTLYGVQIAINAPGNGVISSPTGIAVDTSGNMWVANAGDSTLLSLPQTGAIVKYSGGGLSTPQGVSVDANSAVWVANKGNSSLSKFTSAGTAVSGASGFSGSGQYQSTAVAIDGSNSAWTPALSGKLVEFDTNGNTLSGSSGFSAGFGINTVAIDSAGSVWTTSLASDSLYKFNHDGTAATGSPFTGGGIDTGAGIAIDGAGTVWVANNGGNSISHFSAAGTPITGNPGYQGGNMIGPQGLAIDGAGNIWVASNGNNTLVQFIGLAVPVLTPIAAGLPATPNSNGTSLLGTRP